MANVYKPGDVVQLKSGGPAMTVSEVIHPASKEVKYVCHWFKGASNERGVFAEPELKNYVAPNKS